MSENNVEEIGFFKRVFGRWLGLFLVIAAALVFYLLINNLDTILNSVFYVTAIIKPVIYGCVIAYILNPLMKMYQRWITIA